MILMMAIIPSWKRYAYIFFLIKWAEAVDCRATNEAENRRLNSQTSDLKKIFFFYIDDDFFSFVFFIHSFILDWHWCCPMFILFRRRYTLSARDLCIFFCILFHRSINLFFFFCSASSYPSSWISKQFRRKSSYVRQHNA